MPRFTLPLTLVLAASFSLACKRNQAGDEPYAPTSGPTPTPTEVCQHLAKLAFVEGVDPSIEAEAVRMCSEEMVREQQLRGPTEWDLVARCVLDAKSEADIDRCDQLYPPPQAADQGTAPLGTREDQACIYMITLALIEQAEQNGGQVPELDDEQIQAIHQDCMTAFEQDRQAMAPNVYDAMLECITNAESLAAMELCGPQ